MDPVLDMELSTSRGFDPGIRPLCTDESDLVRKAQDGDVEAFEALVEVYTAKVYSIAYRIAGNRDDAEDICQESFIKLHRNIRAYSSNHKFTTWLFRLVTNTAIDHIRRQNRSRRLSVETGLPDRSQTGDSDLKLTLDRILNKVSPKQRMAFVLRDLQGFPLNEVAQILGCSGVTARVHLHKARTRIRKSLENEVLSSTRLEATYLKPYLTSRMARRSSSAVQFTTKMT